MRCPQCQCLDDKVVDSRVIKDGEGVRRRRECLNCGHRYTTYEAVIHAELKVVKKGEIREDFDREKLRLGIEKACWKRPVEGADIDRVVSSARIRPQRLVRRGEVPAVPRGPRKRGPDLA